MEILVGENKLPGYSCQMSREKRELEPGCRGRAGRDKPRAIPVQSREEATRAQQQGPLGQHCAPLVDPVQIAPGHVRHPDGTCRAVEKLISISEKEKKCLHFRASQWNGFGCTNPRLYLFHGEQHCASSFPNKRPHSIKSYFASGSTPECIPITYRHAHIPHLV